MAMMATTLHTITAMVAMRFRSSRLRCSSFFRCMAARRMASVFWLTVCRRVPWSACWGRLGACCGWGIRPVAGLG